MRDLAVRPLAGGGRIIILAFLLLIIVALTLGWIVYARRGRRNRGQS